MERAKRQFEVEMRFSDRNHPQMIQELRFNEQESLAEDLQAIMGELDGRLAEIDGNIAGISDDKKEEFKRRLEEKIREILENLGDRMEQVNADVASELESLEIDLKELEPAEAPAPVRVRVHNR